MAILDFYHDTAIMQQRVHSGVCADQTLDDYLQQHVRQHGDKAVLVDRRWRLTFAELARLAGGPPAASYILAFSLAM
jgi:non-ribosomal peptide synthetase component E (peptide arylation enzyme)